MTYQLLHGATAQPQSAAQSALFDSLIGVNQSLVHMDWSTQQGNKPDGTPNFTPFPTSIADGLWKRGQLYLHSWGTWDWVNRVAWSTADILAGKYDTYWHSEAKRIAAWGHPLIVRLNHEFNGAGWAPWYRSGADHVALWHYVVSLFKADGATNIGWLWCPNEVSTKVSDAWSAANLPSYLPPLADVDYVGVDTYNAGNSKVGTTWRTFAQTLDFSYTTITALAPGKPFVLAEFACHTAPGDRVAWINDAMTVIPKRYPAVFAISWYQVTDGASAWPMVATDGSAAAWTAGLARGPYDRTGAPTPPDGQPLVPLQSVSAWGDPLAPLQALQGQLATTTAQLSQVQQDASETTEALAESAATVAQISADLAANQQQVTALTAKVDQYRSAGQQITAGLDALRSLTVQPQSP